MSLTSFSNIILLFFMTNCIILSNVNICNGVEKDLYNILGVSKDATAKEIKKAYKRQAMQWHPDKNRNNEEEATEKFQQIGEAYEILSDENARRNYDQFGFDGIKNSFQHGNFDAFSMFESFFGENSGGRFGGNHGGGHSAMFEEFFKGDGGFPGGFPGGGGGGGGGSASSFSFSSGGFPGGGGGSFSSMSEETMFVNGKKIRKVSRNENGRTIEETYENDKLIEKIVDGSKQNIKKIDL